jgi:hypothetical protein
MKEDFGESYVGITDDISYLKGIGGQSQMLCS